MGEGVANGGLFLNAMASFYSEPDHMAQNSLGYGCCFPLLWKKSHCSAIFFCLLLKGRALTKRGRSSCTMHSLGISSWSIHR